MSDPEAKLRFGPVPEEKTSSAQVDRGVSVSCQTMSAVGSSSTKAAGTFCSKCFRQEVDLCLGISQRKCSFSTVSQVTSNATSRYCGSRS